TIVDRSFFRIGEHVERFAHLLEAFFGCLVPRIYVRVIFARQPPISFFDLVRLGVALDAQDFVIVLFSHLFLDAEMKRRGDAASLFAPRPRVSMSPRHRSYFLSSSTSTYSASITLSSPPPVWLPDDAPAADDCSVVSPP